MISEVLKDTPTAKVRVAYVSGNYSLYLRTINQFNLEYMSSSCGLK